MTAGGPWVGIALGLIALVVLGIATRELVRWAGERRHGRLAFTDDRASAGGLVSPRYRLVGRPDEIRRLRDGRPVPVEWKSRSAPPRGPPASHQVQVWAYCLLLEDTTGFRPPYGVLRYADGQEFELPWDDAARARLLHVRRAVARPYDGRADPSPYKCARCPWRPGCDARAPLPGAARRRER